MKWFRHSLRTALFAALTALLLSAAPLSAQEGTAAEYYPFPEPDSGYVTDLADLMPEGEEELLEQLLWKVESESGVEIIVVTIYSRKDFPDAPNGSIEEFAAGLFNSYGIGNLPANNGVLLLVASKDRRARIELGAGYGRMRDGEAERIMSKTIVPQFRKGKYSAGITDGVHAIVEEFADLEVGLNWFNIILLASIPVLLMILISLLINGKRGWGWVVVGLLVVLVLLAVQIAIALRQSAGASSGWSSGGLGGFGGGFSGGGGATGSW